MTGSRLSVTDHDREPPTTAPLRHAEEVRAHTRRIVSETPVFDMHTHLFPPAFGDLSRWGIDHLVTYHYLVAEVMRAADVRPADFHRMPQHAQADLIWDALFVRSTPLSEATRGVVCRAGPVLCAGGAAPAPRPIRHPDRALFVAELSPFDDVVGEMVIMRVRRERQVRHHGSEMQHRRQLNAELAR